METKMVEICHNLVVVTVSTNGFPWETEAVIN